MSAIPYDWKGTAKTNQFTEERILESDIASERVLVLQHRPFFQSGFSVRQATASNPLTQGVDYELAYQLTELDDSVAGPVFCGVNIINPAIKGSLVFTGNHLGGTFYDGLLESFDTLVKYLNNPTSARWLNVGNRPSLYPVMPAATSWHDLLNKKYVASAIHDVELDAGSANDEIKAKLDQLKVTVESLHAEIQAFDYPSHVNAKNPHDTTAVQIGAHPISLKAADTFLTYGKTLRQLTAEIRALGLQQSDIDKYIETWAFKDVQGTFVQLVQANRPIFKSKNGASSILFTDTGFDLTSTGGIALRAGYKGDAAYFEWVAGNNVMRIESSGNALGMDKLSVNGVTLLTTTSLMDYQASGDNGGTDPDDNKLYVQSETTGLTYTGKGSKADPVKWELAVPDASVSSDGAVTLTGAKSDVVAGQAVTPASVAAYDAELGQFVPKATRLNSVAMDDGSRVLGKGDIGLGNADNTADVDKPLSTDLTTALAGKSNKGHKHTWASLNIPNATEADAGVVRLAPNEASLADGRAAAPNVLYQLQLQLADVAEKLKGANPKAVADYAVIGGATWSVASSKLALSVQDLKYFYMANGGRKEGRVTGSVNLETTPMFNWYQPTNVIERNWAKGVLHNTQLPLTSAVTTLPLYARTIGLTATQMGDLSIISVLAKERVACSSGRLRVIASAGGNISVYINGDLVASGASTVDNAFDVDTASPVHTVALRADCNDSTKPAAIAFEIWDNNYPVVASSPDTKLVQLSEFINPRNNRHFVYLNMSTNSLFGRAEPIPSNDISITQAYVGFVDCGAAGMVGTTVTFDTVADFGQFRELGAHQTLIPAHVPESTDWYLSDNPEMKRLAIASDKPDYIVAGVAGAANLAASVLTLKPSVDGTGPLTLWMDARYSGPQQWMTPANPYENNLLTYEGSLALYIPVRRVLGNTQLDLWLTFAQKARNGQHKFFHINVFTNEAEYGYLPEMAVNPTATATRGAPAVATFDVHPYEMSVVEATDPSVWGEEVKETGQSRYIVRYRYVPKTNTLRVELVRFEDNRSTPVIRKVTYELPFDVRDCMNGFVGFNRKELSSTSQHTLHAGIYPSADYHNYSYFRSLFEAYIRSADYAVQGAGRGMQQRLLAGGIPANWNVLAGVTEFIGIPTAGNNAIRSRSKYSPLAVHADRMPAKQRVGAEVSRAKVWTNTNNPQRGASYTRRFALVIEAPADFTSLDWLVSSNYNFVSYCNTSKLHANNPQGGAVASSRLAPTISGVAGDLLYIEFVPLAISTPFFLESTITFKDGSTTVGTIDFSDDNAVVVMEDTAPTLFLCKYHPFSLTTAMWDWVTGIMRSEEGVSTELGVWN